MAGKITTHSRSASQAYIETKWPGIVDQLHRRENVNDFLVEIFGFMALQRERVPASRDVSEMILAEVFKMRARTLDLAGKLPPKPAGFEDILDHVEVSIDPHQSIHAMIAGIQGVGQVFDQIGFYAVHNKTDVPFLTSDNPVIWFDPSVQDSDLQPYILQPDGPVVLLFPVSPSLIIYGDSSRKEQFASEGLGILDLADPSFVEAINRQVCRFAYEAIFARTSGHERLIREHAALSPVPQFERISSGKGEKVAFQMVFGKRERKPKWVD